MTRSHLETYKDLIVYFNVIRADMNVDGQGAFGCKENCREERINANGHGKQNAEQN